MIADVLKEDFRRDYLTLLKAQNVLGMRSDEMLRSLKKSPRYVHITDSDLAAEMLKMAANGYVMGEPAPLNPAVVNYTLTPKGHEYCWELGLGS